MSAIVVDKNIAKKCALEKQTSWFSAFSILSIHKVFKEFLLYRRSTAFQLNEAIGRLKFKVGDVKASDVAKYFKSQSFQVLLEIQAITSLLKVKKPKVVVLASDAHRVSRIVVFLCKQMNIKTVVYQHGATVWEYGYVPVLADNMLIWGEASREWFELRGVEPLRLTEIGNLRSDLLGSKEFTPELFTKNRKIYFFPNPIDRKITEEALVMLIKLCKKYNYPGIVKIHPSETNLEFFSSRIAKANGLISISALPIDKAGIIPGDVAIVVNSTAGVDCCLEGALVLNIEVENMPNPIDYEGYQVGVKTNLKDYIKDFERLISIRPEEFLNHRKAFIRSYLGELDGSAAQRASDFIINLVGRK